MPNHDGMAQAKERAKTALAGLRQRRGVRALELHKTNKRSLDELDPEDPTDEELLDPVLKHDTAAAASTATSTTQRSTN